ncbi:tetratricopeptide repeat protein [Carboxylicivirga sp. N1Y90]|uniref:tetratricopeptide repeat protein n=1 Tax=Carboxylicivirga fragile TaxID=3417571 RepID=UPI003D32801B|nr:tetratricopeptide repeat protein [Marinilabiliaceae bacterium N1Y90]
MKIYITYLLLIFSSLLMHAQDDRFEKGNADYSNGNYHEAITNYQSILETGVESGDLYFNLANAYYKNGQLADAILNYERALLLKPQDKDVKYNLELAYSQTTDKITPIGGFFISKWHKSFQNKATSDFWAIIGICGLLLTLICAALFIYSRSVILKKAGFYLSFAFFILTITGIVFAYQQKQKLTERNHAIVFSPSLTVKSSPDASGTEIFILHEGTKVEIINTLGTWKEIELADGNVGWIEEHAITVI